ncbi:hypothetical protein N0V84_000772 [Fusarium piperis]|uniref:Uncharacterized protein n=1 Tax=Fusarium piperis TaxID=1435070 RepID=A0A9W8WMU1_9HYPO|nr:hypothetical protein N0V84_000772 [Fusarium piperis]
MSSPDLNQAESTLAKCIGAWTKRSNVSDPDSGTETNNETIIDNAASTDDLQCVMVIDDKLYCREKSGRTYPMETMPEVLKQWLKDECRDALKKEEWITCLMEVPLDPNWFGSEGLPPYSGLTSLELESAAARSRYELNQIYPHMEETKLERNKKLEEALMADFFYGKAKKMVEWRTMVIQKSLERYTMAIQEQEDQP